MMRGRKKLICLLGGVALCGPVTPGFTAAENPYAAIVERNVFALKPPPPPASTEPEKAPPPNIMLTGITTIFGNKRAIMRTPPVAGKPGEAPREQSFFLAEGQQEGEMEVLQIDEKLGTVKVKYGGTPVTLSFDKNAPKMAGAAAPGAPGTMPGVPMPAGGLPPPPHNNNPFSPAADGGFKSIPTRTLRLPNATPGVTPTGASYTPTSGYNAAAGTYNGVATTGGNGVATTWGTGVSQVQSGAATLNLSSLTQPASAQRIQPNWPPEVPMTAEEQSVLHQVQSELHKNDPSFPGFPGETPPVPGQTTTQPQPVNNNNNTQNRLPLPPGGFGRTY